jgi:hypothetical protein
VLSSGPSIRPTREALTIQAIENQAIENSGSNLQGISAVSTLARILKQFTVRHHSMTAPKLKLVARDQPILRAAIYCRYSDEDQNAIH